MGSDKSRRFRYVSAFFGLPLALAMVLSVPMQGMAQGPGTEDGQWTYLGGDAWHTRYTPAESNQRVELRGSRSSVAVECRQLWAEHSSCDPNLRGRQADHGHVRPSQHGRPQPCNG